MKYTSDVPSIWEKQHGERELGKCLSGVETDLEERRNSISYNNVWLPVGFCKMCGKEQRCAKMYSTVTKKIFVRDFPQQRLNKKLVS